jgi:hypothetical protein
MFSQTKNDIFVAVDQFRRKVSSKILPKFAESRHLQNEAFGGQNACGTAMVLTGRMNSVIVANL